MGMFGEITNDYLGSLAYIHEIRRKTTLKESPDITAIVGPRRAGKTFIMLKKAKSLASAGKQVVFVSFDDPVFDNIDHRKFAEEVRREYPEGRIFLFLDEVQEWESWDKRIRWLHDVKDFTIFVSGSSSTLQSSEIPSRLRGRYISKLVLPLSFGEVAEKPKDFRSSGAVKKLFDEYAKWGGFPEVWLTRSREKIISILETAMYRDAMERYRISDPSLFREFFNFAISNFSNMVTYSSLRRPFHDLIKDHKTVSKYISAMESSFLIFLVRKFSMSEKEKILSPKKLYTVDHSFASLFEAGKDMGRKLENMVFVEILRRYGMPEYYLTREREEVDFYIRKIKTFVEVSMRADKEHVGKVLSAMEETGAKTAFLLTYDDEDEIRKGRRKIHIIPAWKWLLE